MLILRPTFRRLNATRMNLPMYTIGLLSVAMAAWGQPRGIKPGEAIDVAPEVEPDLYKATAVKQDGDVMIRISARETRIANVPPDDKKAKPWIACWTEMKPLILGRQIRAYKSTGQKLTDAAVLEALAKPVPVLCFQRKHESDPEQPDAFYANVFRDSVVILVFEAEYWFR